MTSSQKTTTDMKRDSPAVQDDPQRNGPYRVMQTEMGSTGNCQSACLASLLGVPLSDVPNFAAMEGDDNLKYIAQQKWLNERGWALLTVVKWQTLPWPPTKGYYIAGGISPRGNRHSVIYLDGKPWHDPHPEGGGIKEVEDIDFLYPLNPCALSQPAQPPTTPRAPASPTSSARIR